MPLENLYTLYGVTVSTTNGADVSPHRSGPGSAGLATVIRLTQAAAIADTISISQYGRVLK